MKVAATENVLYKQTIDRITINAQQENLNSIAQRINRDCANRHK
ncbi:hypothetical protein NIES22_55060 [Calothrix brevissima NIES-22]|nr:hypothetical protein NIES22_55060 [Calothrix brevissima NIES-22]